ncbi:MAG: MBL fold metallo-hydrolase [Anaerovoracaceae bacterium]|jgi:metal-dependent hydrolase (beta-lactamase superfamily II)
MKIINLIEDTEGNKDCLCEHGLSFYIEAGNHKILADTGASDKFLENADSLGVDLTAVDVCFISHGHYDHAGGLLSFAHLNSRAQIYISRLAARDYYSVAKGKTRYIGIDKCIAGLSNLHPVAGSLHIDDTLEIFSGVSGSRLQPAGNRIMFRKSGDDIIRDNFDHEQYLIISEKGRKVLISGCAHNGIVNILEEYRRRYGAAPDAVISGFHMFRRSGKYTEEDMENVTETARELMKYKSTEFFTCHCTGREPYSVLKEMMGSQLNYVHSGSRVLL